MRADDDACRVFEDVADRGLLRAYLLELGDTPCAFVIGYQYEGVYHYAELGFRDDFTELSPGTVLLFHIIKDLHEQASVVCLNFGVGDAPYKRRFGNRETSDISCLMMRNTVLNRLISMAHQLFSWSIDKLKILLGRTGAEK